MDIPAKPTAGKPQWATDTEALKTEPGSTKKNSGWETEVISGRIVGERPLMNYENWLKYSTFLWIEWAEDAIDYLEANTLIVPEMDARYNQSLVTPRTKLVFRSAYDVYVLGTKFYMDGFRFQGVSYKQTSLQGNNPVTLTGGSGSMSIAAVTDGNREYFTTLRFDTWYATFACLNSTTTDQDCTMKTVPFLRVHSVVGNKVYLAENMGRNSSSAPSIGAIANISWDSASLIGKEVLICQETFPGGRLNHPSGRIATVTAADNESITLDDVGTLDAFDYILPAPTLPYYHYCGSFYIDSAEVMNFADSGHHVGTRGISITPQTPSGVNAGEFINCTGHISPLATGIILSNATLVYFKSTFNEYFEDGGSHNVVLIGGVTETFKYTMVTVPFIFKQEFKYKTEGGDAIYRHSHSMLVLGYYEP